MKTKDNTLRNIVLLAVFLIIVIVGMYTTALTGTFQDAFKIFIICFFAYIGYSSYAKKKKHK